MTFIEDLKIIIPENVSKLLFNFDVKLDFSKPKNEKCYEISKDEKLVTIIIKNLSPKEDRHLKRALKKHFDNDELFLVEESKTALLNRLYKFNNKEDNQILAFFKPILSGKDWQTLRDSLFLRNEFRNQIPIGGLKHDIISRYGERGNVISNMCTAGYFEETMIPLYNASQTEFWSYYDMSIDRGITALFVNKKMSIAKIRDEIKRRIISGKAYGLQCIHIHGIGETNINKIKECLEKEKNNLGFTEKNIFNDTKLHIMVVEVIL